MSPGNPSIKNSKGFTFLELSVVLLLMGLIMALAAPKLAGNRPGVDLKMAAKTVAAMMRVAGGRAISEHIRYCVAVNIDEGKLFFYQPDLISEDETVETYLENDQNLESGAVKLYQCPKGIIIKEAVYPGTDPEIVDTGWFGFLFYANGSCSGGTLYLVNEKETGAKIEVAFVTGVVRIEV